MPQRHQTEPRTGSLSSPRTTRNHSPPDSSSPRIRSPKILDMSPEHNMEHWRNNTIHTKQNIRRFSNNYRRRNQLTKKENARRTLYKQKRKSLVNRRFLTKRTIPYLRRDE